MDHRDLDIETLHQRAYDAFDAGRLKDSSTLFAELLRREPDAAHYHYMRGLTHKYLLDWPTSLRHNLDALALEQAPNEGAVWNGAIAATALGDWAQARRLWTLGGIAIPEGTGPIEADYGIVSIRLNPWGDGETLYARRIDLVRARLLNVPLPDSGYRYGDIVLHDGARTGERGYFGQRVPVFNALARLVPSDLQTYVAFVSCESADDIAALGSVSLPGYADAEDWSASIVHYCLRCSYGAPHSHASAQDDADWEPERSLGIAAQSRRVVDKLLRDWTRGGRGRRVDAVNAVDALPQAPADGGVWWCAPDDEEEPAE
ncbi:MULTISPECIES: hypothetical protein [unclassified Lysobacter]|uniref:tetratricopeptide repeat protein n=1 Tax=unclassified Lysobacter TaxID=2635362 RepID=UPI0006F42849|nr:MULTISPECIES: hypothetical protein [unclassified Lysobacter]KRA20401.1 hypothetical protein ASD69_03395 [Lysobacter sp. Root604]KRD39418.1 hypothetical protein ASE35_03410 [Lysobacter sp. Root916]